MSASAYDVSQGGALGVLWDYAGNGSFSPKTLNNIAKAVGYSDIEALVNNFEQNSNATPIQADQFGNKTLYFSKSGQTSSVHEWIPAYISSNGDATNPQAILTLWLARAAGTGSYSDGTYYNFSNTASVKAPVSNMYSSSYLHARINGGETSTGYYAGNFKNTGATMYTVSQSSNGLTAPSTFVNFNEFMPSGKFSSYIVAPKDVGWQKNENSNRNDYGHADYSGHVDANGKYAYNSWTNDNLWLPSKTEVDLSGGIWGTTAAQNQNGVNTWLRSGVNNHNAHYLVSTTGATNQANVTNEYAVRPAMHLNLSAVVKAANVTVPTANTIEDTYTGNKLSFTIDGISSKIDISVTGKRFDGQTSITISNSDIVNGVFKPTEAGKYTVTFNIKQSYIDEGLEWYDSAGGTTKRELTFTVKQCEVKYKWANIGLDSSWKTTYAQTFTPATGTSAAPWVYLNYTLPVSTDNTASGGSGGTTSNNKVPYVILTFTGTQSQFADYKISNIDNVRSATSKGSDYPKHADSYTVSFTDKNATTSNYKLVADTGESATRQYTIERLEVDAPTPAALPYNGDYQSFSNVANFDSKIMTYGQLAADGVTYNENTTPVQSDGTTAKITASVNGGKLTLTAKDADKYDIYYRLLTETTMSGGQEVRDYMWTGASASDPAPIKKVTYEIKPKTLEFTFTSSSNGWSIKFSDITNKLTYDYAAGKEPVNGEEPVLELYYYLNSDGETNAVKHSDNAEILFKDLKDKNGKRATGKYTVVIKLADCDETTNTVNKNYLLNSSLLDGLTGSALEAAKATYQKEINVIASEASIDDIEILYNTAKKEADGEAAVAIPSDGLKYGYDSVSKQATEYKFELGFLNLEYLTYADTNSISWQYSDGNTTANKAGKLTVTVKIKVKDSEAANHSLPAAFDVTQTNKFTSYLNNNDGTATLTFEVEIGKREITVAGSEIPLKYQREGGQVTDYDPKNPPEFNGKPVAISLPHESLYPHGIKAIEFDEATPKKTQAGTYTIGATVTLDDNHCLANGNSTLHVDIPWEISKEVIKLAWGKPVYFDEYFNDSTVAHLQVMLLSGLTDVQEGAVKYSFFKTVDGAPDTTPLSEAELKALCTNDRFTDPNEMWLYVKAELTEDGAKKYKIEEDATKNPKKFKLGGQMTLIELKIDEEKIDGYEYGGGLDLGEVFTLINTETGDRWDSSYYEIRVLKDGVDICALSEFDPDENGVGKYVIRININPEYAESYTLDKSNNVNFEVHHKEIAIPTVGEIIFSGNGVSLADYLSESYAQNAGIISISGDCADIRNVSQSGYKARLTITDPNYKWAKPAEAEAVKYQLFAIKLFDSEAELLDDYVVELKWNVAPLTVDVTELWVKEKNGATLNLPESVLSLINAETLSVLYRYYDGAEQYVESPELKGGQSFRVEAMFDGIDAQSGNVLFINADGNVSTTSDRINYTVPQSGFAAAMGSTLNFLKANWMWIAIGTAALLFLIILICAIAHAKKKKKARLAAEEQRRIEKEEREREERRLEREERMSRMNQQQPMPQIMQMPQMPMQMPQPQPQYAPQPQAMGGMADSAQLTRIENELAAMKAAQAARELAEIKAEQAAMHSDINTLKTDGGKTQFAGISVDAMTEIMTMALKNVLVSATQQAAIPAQPAQPAQITDGSAQVPPDAVMTTVTTTKIDTTKKTAQNGQEYDRDRNRSTRSFVAPMPVDDGRVFDVGGFYKPADPSDFADPDEEGK